MMQRITKRLATTLILAYQYSISPLLLPSCRFTPTCSEYAKQAIERYGFWHGTRLGLLRLLRCHPFHPGGYDPPSTVNSDQWTVDSKKNNRPLTTDH
jgi:hypothetical protein